MIASSKNQSMSFRDLISDKSSHKPSKSSTSTFSGSSLSESDLQILEEYIELGKQYHQQNTTVDIFYFVPSLNTIVENDLERWGYVDPNHPTASQQRPSSITPPPTSTGVYRSLSNSSMPSPQRPRTKLTLNTHHEQSHHPKGSSYPDIPHMSPRRSDIVKCSNDNSAIYAEVTRITGGNLHLFFGSLHLEDNVDRLKCVSLPSVICGKIHSPFPL